MAKGGTHTPDTNGQVNQIREEDGRRRLLKKVYAKRIVCIQSKVKSAADDKIWQLLGQSAFVFKPAIKPLKPVGNNIICTP